MVATNCEESSSLTIILVMGFRSPNTRYILSFLQRQHHLCLPLRMRLRVPNSQMRLPRPLSSTPNDLRYRVSPKQQG